MDLENEKILNVYTHAKVYYDLMLHFYSLDNGIDKSDIENLKYADDDFEMRKACRALNFFRGAIESLRLAMHTLGYDEKGQKL